jgi:hypothetical protein
LLGVEIAPLVLEEKWLFPSLRHGYVRVRSILPSSGLLALTRDRGIDRAHEIGPPGILPPLSNAPS